MHDSDAKAHWLENKQITNSSIPRCLTFSNVLELKINTASVYFGKTTGAGEKMTQWLATFSTLVEDQIWVPGIHVGQLSTN